MTTKSAEDLAEEMFHVQRVVMHKGEANTQFHTLSDCGKVTQDSFLALAQWHQMHVESAISADRAEWQAHLKDPATVLANILRGEIALPSCYVELNGSEVRKIKASALREAATEVGMLPVNKSRCQILLMTEQAWIEAQEQSMDALLARANAIEKGTNET